MLLRAGYYQCTILEPAIARYLQIYLALLHLMKDGLIYCKILLRILDFVFHKAQNIILYWTTLRHVTYNCYLHILVHFGQLKQICLDLISFFYAITKLQKATLSSAMPLCQSVRLSIHIHKIGSQEINFYKFDIQVFFENLARKLMFFFKI